MRARLPRKGLMEVWETCIQGTCPIQIFSCYPNTIFLSRGKFDALWLLVSHPLNNCTEFGTIELKNLMLQVEPWEQDLT